MSLLRNSKKFSFRSKGKKDLTVEELREDMETMYLFLEERIRQLDKEAEIRIVALENETP